MNERYIDLQVGDTLVVHVKGKAPPSPPTPVEPEELDVFLTVGHTKIYANADKSYVMFKSDLDVCTDGSGPSHSDQYHQSQTAYWNGGKFLNADVDRYVVVPPQIRSGVPGVVMGCQAKVTNLKTNVTSVGVVGDIGPKDKTGECAICLAQILNPNVSANVGDSNTIYLYELWAGVPAVVDGKTYALEPA